MSVDAHDSKDGAASRTGKVSSCGTTNYDIRGGPVHRSIENFLGILGALETSLAGWNAESSIGITRPGVDLDASNFTGSEEQKAKWLLLTYT
jgi:hypothetical protein